MGEMEVNTLFLQIYLNMHVKNTVTWETVH